MRFQGKRALVTGASRGIGRAISVLLASEGAQVAIHYDADAEGAEETATACAMAGGAVPAVVRGDLGSWDDGARLVGEAAAALGGLDLLIANAGAPRDDGWDAPLEEMTEATWDRVLAADLRGTFTTARAAGRIMRDGGRGGTIVAICSTTGPAGDRRGAAHDVARGGVLALGRLLARAFAPQVRVNTVALGAFAARWVEKLDPEAREATLGAIPLGRFGHPEEAARAILFLASDDAAFISGQTLVVDGGEATR